MADDAPSPQNRPNIVLIMCDQLRGDCLGCDGHPVVETPNLDTMALEGVRFSRAYSATPTCIPARAGLYTGQSPSKHGRVGYLDSVPWNYKTTMAGELAAAGYHTQAVGKMHVHPARSLMGFHNVILHDGYLHCGRDVNRRLETIDDYLPWLRERAGSGSDYIDNGLECNSWVARPWHLDESLHPTTWAAAQSIDFLRRRDPRRPFFLFTSFVRPHAPLDPPQVYWDQYINQDIPEPVIGDWAEEFPQGALVHASGHKGSVRPRALRRARAAYYALITHVDHQIGRLMQALFEHKLLENTIVIFTADHGDLLGDHNLLRKALPYEGSARIPMIAWTSPRFDMGLLRGNVVDAPVELRDVMPTLLDAAGAPIPASVEGKSLLPLARGERVSWRDYLHGEHTVGDESAQYLTDGREKYIWFSGSGREQLFDLENDPCELHNRAEDADAAKRLEHWRARLVRELTGREEGMSDGRKLITGRPVDPCLRHIRPQ
ncbi:MAG: arylsulfatase [Planctomycetes bacterium]|nr:arylsulfatase [Planctomycetota bacterium]